MWQKLAVLNLEIGEREFQKDATCFDNLLVPAFRPEGNPEFTISDRRGFLVDLETSLEASPK